MMGIKLSNYRIQPTLKRFWRISFYLLLFFRLMIPYIHYNYKEINPNHSPVTHRLQYPPGEIQIHNKQTAHLLQVHTTTTNLEQRGLFIFRGTPFS